KAEFGGAGFGTLGRHHHAAATPGTVPLYVRAEGSRPFVPDRRNAIDPFGLAPLRNRGAGWPADRRYPRSLELRRCDDVWAGASGRPAAVAPSDPRDAPTAATERARRHEKSRRVSAVSELDRWLTSRQRTFRAAAADRDGWLSRCA